MKTKKSKKKKALLYARVACQNKGETPNRLKHQIDELEIYCQDHNIEVEGIYSEVAGGNSFDREEFQFLLRDIKVKNVKADLLLFTKWDRFSRSFNGMAKMVKHLEKVGVKPQAIKDKGISLTIYSILKHSK